MTDALGLDLPLVYAGKVRRLYSLPDADADATPIADAAATGARPSGDRAPARLLMVVTDAISAYDHVLATPIPDKGAILTRLSLWWFDQLGDIVPHHVVSTRVPDAVAGRALVTERLDMVPVECVARGYLTGSGWAEYQQLGTVVGMSLPAGLRDGDRLPEPIFTPAVKAPLGEHDENVSFDRLVELHGPDAAAELRDLTLALYRRAEEIARGRGIILADTKFEFGRRPDGTLVLADEVLTPDSSRFWDAASWRPGESLPSFDKQYVRDWLAQASGWDRSSDAPPPPLPDEVVAATRARYVEAYERLTGQEFRVDGATGFETLAGLAPQPSGVGLAVQPSGSGAVAEPRAAEPPEPFDPGHVPAANLLVGGALSAEQVGRTRSDKIPSMARVVVDVMPKPEILDPQGKAVTGALRRLGFSGLTVRQGKRFEIDVDGDITPERLDEVRDAAERLLANTVIESFDVRVEQA